MLRLPLSGASVPTIRDLVATLRRFDGVQGAAVLGRDGLLIDNEADAGLDGESIAAHVPSILQSCDDLGHAASIGGLQTAVLEHGDSTVVLAAMSSDVVLLVIVKPDANLGALLYDIRRHRAGLASLV
jgi:predicted regulator of Ras-like GTPase activity (Roadblock/LC7/MglB family)